MLSISKFIRIVIGAVLFGVIGGLTLIYFFESSESQTDSAFTHTNLHEKHEVHRFFHVTVGVVLSYETPKKLFFETQGYYQVQHIHDEKQERNRYLFSPLQYIEPSQHIKLIENTSRFYTQNKQLYQKESAYHDQLKTAFLKKYVIAKLEWLSDGCVEPTLEDPFGKLRFHRKSLGTPHKKYDGEYDISKSSLKNQVDIKKNSGVCDLKEYEKSLEDHLMLVYRNRGFESHSHLTIHLKIQEFFEADFQQISQRKQRGYEAVSWNAEFPFFDEKVVKKIFYQKYYQEHKKILSQASLDAITLNKSLWALIEAVKKSPSLFEHLKQDLLSQTKTLSQLDEYLLGVLGSSDHDKTQEVYQELLAVCLDEKCAEDYFQSLLTSYQFSEGVFTENMELLKKIHQKSKDDEALKQKSLFVLASKLSQLPEVDKGDYLEYLNQNFQQAYDVSEIVDSLAAAANTEESQFKELATSYLQHEDERVREKALETLVYIDKEETDEMVFEILEKNKNAWEGKKILSAMQEKQLIESRVSQMIQWYDEFQQEQRLAVLQVLFQRSHREYSSLQNFYRERHFNQNERNTLAQLNVHTYMTENP